MVGFAIHHHESAMGAHVSPHPEPSSHLLSHLFPLDYPRVPAFERPALRIRAAARRAHDRHTHTTHPHTHTIPSMHTTHIHIPHQTRTICSTHIHTTPCIHTTKYTHNHLYTHHTTHIHTHHMYTHHTNIHTLPWCWSWNSNTLATWCEELTHWKRP